MTTTTTDWRISGTNIIRSDASYGILQEIMKNEILTDEEKISSIQKKLGHCAPIETNHEAHCVHFYRF